MAKQVKEQKEKAKPGKKKKFSNNQIVVFQFGDRNLVGKVSNVKPVGKKSYIYDVTGENGKVYEDLSVDAAMKHSISTHLTKLYYKKYDISEDIMPMTEAEEAEMNLASALAEQMTSTLDESTPSPHRDEELFTVEDTDPNW